MQCVLLKHIRENKKSDAEKHLHKLSLIAKQERHNCEGKQAESLETKKGTVMFYL